MTSRRVGCGIENFALASNSIRAHIKRNVIFNAVWTCQERFEKALETLGVPKQKWAQVRTKFMRVLLEEHDNILRSYQAQKHGSGDGMGAIAGRAKEWTLA